MTEKSAMQIPKYVRIAPAALQEDTVGEESVITGPADFVAMLKPRYGVVLASWDQANQLGAVSRLGVVLQVGPESLQTILRLNALGAK